MADADGATRISDLAKLEAALKDLNDPGKPELSKISTCHALEPYSATVLTDRRGCSVW